MREVMYHKNLTEDSFMCGHREYINKMTVHTRFM
jgi:hypothetical protein